MLVKKLLQKGIKLRLFLIVLQCVSNYIIPDHNANVFMYPSTKYSKTKLDDLIFTILGGLIRWDGQYFMHIALYGYTYENTLPFFPLLPLTVRYIASLFQLPFINFETQVLLVFTIFNFGSFLLAIVVLYLLTRNWLGQQKAQDTALLFCINPASIFFTAAYTECLFSLLTFTSIYCCWKIHFKAFFVSPIWLLLSIFSIMLSCLTRSNGLLNLGFLAYFFLGNLISNICNGNNWCIILLKLFCNLIILALSLIVSVYPFIMLQFYHYSNYCSVNNISLPQEVINYAHLNGHRLMGNFYDQAWCNYFFIPMPYSYVQETYWNVGFFKYYELKQLPNFLLALPVIYITISESLKFIANNRNYLLHLGIFKGIFLNHCNNKNSISNHYNRPDTRENDLLFVCVMHALFLCIFCIMYVHIQVTTRMLFSSNPVIYWFCLNKNQSIIKLYCFSYCCIGTILFCNFLPWT